MLTEKFFESSKERIKKKMGDALYSVKSHMRKIEEILTKIITYNLDRLIKLNIEI